MKKIALLPVLVLALACGSKKESKTPEEEMTKKVKELEKITKNNPNINAGSGNYDIKAPEGWTKSKESMAGIDYIIAKAPVEDAKDRFQENVNVGTEKVPASYGLDAYVDASLSNIGKQLSNYKTSANEDVEINGMKAKRITYSHSMMGNDIEVMAYFVLENNIAYVITCSAQKGKLAKYKSDFESIANSFSLN